MAYVDGSAAFMENAKCEDIRKGDLVRTERENLGVKEICEGIAFEAACIDGRKEWQTQFFGWLNVDFADRITILNRPEPDWKEGDLAFDADDDVWLCNGADWSCINRMFYPRSTTELEKFGPIRRAKVVEE